MSSCESSCSSACVSECKYTCGTECSTTCGSRCVRSCETTCFTSCMYMCTNGCKTLCTMGCTSTCIMLCNARCEGTSISEDFSWFTNSYELKISTKFESASKRNILLIAINGLPDGYGEGRHGYYVYPTLGGDLRVYRYRDGKLEELISTVKYSTKKDPSTLYVGNLPSKISYGIMGKTPINNKFINHTASFSEYLCKMACDDTLLASTYDVLLSLSSASEVFSDNTVLDSSIFEEIESNIFGAMCIAENIDIMEGEKLGYPSKIYSIVRKIYNDMLQNCPDPTYTELQSVISADLETNFIRRTYDDYSELVKIDFAKVRNASSLAQFSVSLAEWTWNNVNY